MRAKLPEAGWAVVCGKSTAIAEAVARVLCLERATIVALGNGFASDLRRRCSRAAPVLVMVIEPDVDMMWPITRLVKRRWPTARILVVGAPNHEAVVVRCFAAGADGVVLSHEPLDRLTEAVQSVLAGGLRVPAEVRPLVNRLVAVGAAPGTKSHVRLTALSRRQDEILACLGRGCTNKEIATDLHLEVQTVKNHINHILRKLGVGSRSDAVRLGLSSECVASH